MIVVNMYCSKCRQILSHEIARQRVSSEEFHRVSILRRISDTKFECLCNRCGYKWKSSSKEAMKLFENRGINM